MLLLVSLVSLMVSCKQSVESTASDFATYDQYLQEEVKAGRLIGVQGLVYQDGKLVYDKSYGYRDRESKDTMRGDELYFIQSMTKPIISTALMTLYDEGKFQLDDPVSKYLPEFAKQTVVNDPTKGSVSGTHPSPTEITIRQLLSHTAGMSHGIAPIAYDKEIWGATIMNQSIKTLGDRVHVLAGMPLMFDPAVRWTYSFAPDVSARLIEVLSGKSLDAYLKEKIFEPLGMKTIGYNLTEEQQKHIMTVYGFTPDSTLKRMEPQPPSHDNTIFSGVNALFASAKDYLTFATMLLNKGELNGKRILKAETVALMTSDQIGNIKNRLTEKDQFVKLANGIAVDSLGALNLEPGYGFGLGFCILQDPVKALRTENAKGELFWMGANTTHFFVNPEKKLIGMFMTQIASVGNPNPYGFYFSNKMRESIYQDVK